VTEVPPVKAQITEYQFPNVVCGQYGKTSRAPLPEEIAGQFGPHLTALIAYWTVVCRLPRRLPVNDPDRESTANSNTLAVQYETKAEVALRVLKAIAAHGPVSEHDAFQLRFWMSAEDALLPLDQIAHLILRRESNSKSVRTGG
jgi:hypothetical protein